MTRQQATNDTSSSAEHHQHLTATDIMAMLQGLSPEQQSEFYQAIGLEHEEQFYTMLGLCPSANDSLHAQPVRATRAELRPRRDWDSTATRRDSRVHDFRVRLDSVKRTQVASRASRIADASQS